ncbi:MAG TPA: hypothetical protein PKD86_01700 [Gemmatales bacterium]|nr:hypothetical protein [Gemmatales bacterium]
MASSSATPKRPWLRRILAALTLLLLVPVPGLAITFLGTGWAILVSSTGNLIDGDPSPPTHNFTPNPRGGLLEINMGEFLQNGGFSNGPAQLRVTATRDFRVNGASETLRITRSFQSQLANGSIQVTVNIQPYNLANTPPYIIPPVTRLAPLGPPITVNDFSTNNGVFLGGNYRVTITITYTLNGAGGYWKNDTPHRFDFFGI